MPRMLRPEAMTRQQMMTHPDVRQFCVNSPDEALADLRGRVAATWWPISELSFTESTVAPAWKALPSWAAVATGEVEGSHVIMISQPQIVADVIMRAVASVSSHAAAR